MFHQADAFNQPIGGWDVSKGTDFVSNDQSVGLKRSLFFALFPTWMQSQSITHDGRVLNQSSCSFFSC
jgi:hypothetical protein